MKTGYLLLLMNPHSYPSDLSSIPGICGEILPIWSQISYKDTSWQNTTSGKQEVKKAMRSVIWVKYKLRDKEVFDKAYAYIEQYY